MKTHIIPIESHDDAYSVRDRMAWGKSARILLVWPDKGPPALDRRLDLLLLKRRSDELGSQLAVVTRDPLVRGHAADLGIPVYQSTSHAQSSSWQRRGGGRPDTSAEAAPDAVRADPRGSRAAYSTRRGPAGRGKDAAGRGLARRGSGPAVRLAALGAGAAAVLALGGALLPTAVIRLEPRVRTQTVAFTAVTGLSVTAAGVTGSVPAAELSVVVEGRHSTETTGSVLVPSGSAGGEVVFTNLTAGEVVVPEGTVVLTGGDAPDRFVVTGTGTAPAGPGEAITLTVTAVLPGSEGNAPAGAVAAVEGLLGLQVTAANPAALTGGTDVRLAAPSDRDRERASQELLDSLRATAAEELASLAGPEDVVLTPAPVLVATEQETYLPAEAAPSDIVEVTLRVEFRITVVRRADLEALARTVLDAGLEPGYLPVDEAVTLEFVTQPLAGADGAASWEMEVSRVVRSVPDPGELMFDILGKTPDAASVLMESAFDLAASPEIAVSPAWWPRLPLLPVQIEFEMQP